MKRSVIILSATLLALEAAAITVSRAEKLAGPTVPAAPLPAVAEEITQRAESKAPETSQDLAETSQAEESTDLEVLSNSELLTTPEPEPEAPVQFPEEEPEEPVWKDYAAVEADADVCYSADWFCEMGEAYWGGWRWTWYSERVLPGGGLNIPGRHTSGGYVRDEDGYICLASDVLDYGTVIDTPFGSAGRVYDCGVGSDDMVDVYVGW